MSFCLIILAHFQSQSKVVYFLFQVERSSLFAQMLRSSNFVTLATLMVGAAVVFASFMLSLMLFVMITQAWLALEFLCL